MMGIPAGPEAPSSSPLSHGKPVTCPSCGWQQIVMTCAAPGCGRRFIPQPGYSSTLSPYHDPQLEGAHIPSGFREYKAARSTQCVRCGEPCLDRG